MDIQTYLSNSQNIIQIYENLINMAMSEGNRKRVDLLIKERDRKLDELREALFKHKLKEEK